MYLKALFLPEYGEASHWTFVNLCYASFFSFEQAFTYTIGIYIQKLLEYWENILGKQSAGAIRNTPEQVVILRQFSQPTTTSNKTLDTLAYI